MENKKGIYNKDCCSSIVSKGKEFYVNHNDCEIQVDIIAKKIKSAIIWGKVKDCKGTGIENALVKLTKCDCYEYENEQDWVCYTYTDCEGYYQFDIQDCYEGKYKVTASKCANICEHHEQSCNDDYCSKDNNCSKGDNCSKNNHCNDKDRCNKQENCSKNQVTTQESCNYVRQNKIYYC